MKKIIFGMVIGIILMLLLSYKFGNLFSFERGASKVQIEDVLGKAMSADMRIVGYYNDTSSINIEIPFVLINNAAQDMWSWLPDFLKDDTLINSSTLGEKWVIKNRGKVFIGYNDKHKPYDLENTRIIKNQESWDIYIKANYPIYVSKDFGIIAESTYSRGGIVGHSIDRDSLNSIVDNSLSVKFDSIVKTDTDIQQQAQEIIQKDLLYAIQTLDLNQSELNIYIEFTQQKIEQKIKNQNYEMD